MNLSLHSSIREKNYCKQIILSKIHVNVIISAFFWNRNQTLTYMYIYIYLHCSIIKENFAMTCKKHRKQAEDDIKLTLCSKQMTHCEW
jgi:hypothetical protein